MAEKEIKMGKAKDMSVSMEKISNGYLVTKSTYGKDGYSCEKTFTKTAPRLDIGPEPAPKRRSAPSTLAKTTRHLKRK
jgi:hypothetical protein